VERLARSAAEALRAADVLLVATGAGFSADSGLATYDVRSVTSANPPQTPRLTCGPSFVLETPKCKVLRPEAFGVVLCPLQPRLCGPSFILGNPWKP